MEDQHAAMLDATDSRGYTPLHVACAGGHADCVVALCQAGCRTETKNDLGLTAWDLATQLHRTEVLRLRLTELEKIARREQMRTAAKELKAADKRKKKNNRTGPRTDAPRVAPLANPCLPSTPSFASPVDADQLSTQKPKTVLL